MANRIGAIDTSVLVLLAADAEAEEDKPTRDRILRAQSRMQDLRRDGVIFVVPAPVIVEMSRDGDGAEVVARILVEMGGLRVEKFGYGSCAHRRRNVTSYAPIALSRPVT